MSLWPLWPEVNGTSVYLGGAAPGVGVVGAGAVGAGAALGADFFLTGFFTGASSSTTIFLGGCVGVLAYALCSAARRRVTSTSLAPAKVSIRSATERRNLSKALTSFCSDWKSSLDPNAPADSATDSNTS